MRIAQIADIVVPVPPTRYGGTEYIISKVTEGLVKRKHTVTLFASGDSQTQANLIATTQRALGFCNWGTNAYVEAERLPHILTVLNHASSFDVLHNHFLQLLGVTKKLNKPIVTTIHSDPKDPVISNILTMPDVAGTHFVAPSHAQARRLSYVPNVHVVHHGVDVEEFPFSPRAGNYLFFIGRLEKEKGPETAVTIAKMTGLKLVVAAKHNNPPSAYTKRLLTLFAETPNVEYIGEVDGPTKKRLFAGALATLMPIQWEEPFGLVTIESLACGTPVVGYRRGALPEIVHNGITGSLVRTTKEMADAVRKIHQISRKACKDHVARHFSIDRMVDGYETVFKQILETRRIQQELTRQALRTYQPQTISTRHP